MGKNGNYTNTEYNRKVYKDYSERKVSTIIKQEIPKNEKILFVFWHGLGDLLMFLPLYNYFKIKFKNWDFSLAVQPGVGQKEFYPDALELPESDFVRDFHTAFVIAFPMIEGRNNMTKSEYCCEQELGIERVYLGLHTPLPVRNRLVGVHFQGTCLPGSTNTDSEFSKKLCEDLKLLGYIPFDVHFEHSFHNPQNNSFDWQKRSCRDLNPDIRYLQSIIQNCLAFIGVASGPFVLATGIMPNRTIYLQKNHSIDCYLKGFENVIKISEYDSDSLKVTMDKIESEYLPR